MASFFAVYIRFLLPIFSPTLLLRCFSPPSDYYAFHYAADVCQDATIDASMLLMAMPIFATSFAQITMPPAAAMMMPPRRRYERHMRASGACRELRYAARARERRSVPYAKRKRRYAQCRGVEEKLQAPVRVRGGAAAPYATMRWFYRYGASLHC